MTHVDPASEQHVLNPAIAAPHLLKLSTSGRPHQEGKSLPANRRTQARTRKNAAQLQMYD